MSGTSFERIFRGYTVLRIRGESEIAWKPVNGNHFNPTKRRLYKGLKHTKLRMGKKGGRERLRVKHWETQGNRENQGEGIRSKSRLGRSRLS